MNCFNWSPDTCDCILCYDKTEKFLSCSKKCFLHKDISDKKIWSTVLTHNHKHNKTKEAASVECERIRKLGKAMRQ